MKTILKVLLCICAMVVGGAGAAYAGPYEDGMGAFQKRDYAAALRELGAEDACNAPIAATHAEAPKACCPTLQCGHRELAKGYRLRRAARINSSDNKIKGEEVTMKLKQVFQKALKELEWGDEIVHDDDGDDSIRTTYHIDEQAYRMVMSSNEEVPCLSIFLSSPITIPNPRRKEGAYVVNALNMRIAYGCLCISNDTGSVFYALKLFVGDAAVSTAQFKFMIENATGAFDELRATAIGAAAFTKLQGEEIVENYLASLNEASQEESDEEESPKEASDDVPSSL